jgi:hypothetical protein
MEEAMFRKSLKVIVLAFMLLLSACAQTTASNPNQPAPSNPSDPSNPNNPSTPGVPNTPRTASRFFLPTDEPTNTTNPTIEIDAKGGIHTVYPVYAGGDAFYSYCPANCSDETQAKAVRFETDGTVYNIMLALNANAQPHILMSTYQHIYYGSCETNCTAPSSWTVSIIKEIPNGDIEVTGEALAIDPQGRPRFVMHAYRALFGVGQPTPATWYMTCDADCHSAANWQEFKISTQIWQESTLRFTNTGVAKMATVASVEGQGDLSAYIECSADCSNEANWLGIGLFASYSDRNVAEIDPAVSLALTSKGEPRVLTLGKDEAGNRNLVYFSCATNCFGDNWTGQVLINGSEGNRLGAGLDLTVNKSDQPRFVYTAASNILLGYCDTNCEALDAPWNLTKVEFGSDMDADEIIPYPNCTVGAWFLRHPSLALGSDGLPRVAYRAEDMSGGWNNPDPTKPGCVAGVDMTFSRFAQLTNYASE